MPRLTWFVAFILAPASRRSFKAVAWARGKEVAMISAVFPSCHAVVNERNCIEVVHNAPQNVMAYESRNFRRLLKVKEKTSCSNTIVALVRINLWI